MSTASPVAADRRADDAEGEEAAVVVVEAVGDDEIGDGLGE
jgi:hypothetical protein